jgi:peroxiredoxin
MTLHFRLHPVARLARWAGAVCLASSLLACGRPEPAPDIGYTLLDGRQARLADLRGKVVLVNFWSTGCAPCVQEMPGLVRTWKRFAPRGFETLAISTQDDPPFAVIGFASSRRLPFPVAMDQTGEIAHRFGDVGFTPTSLLIDRQGRIVARWIGAVDFDELDASIERLLRER